MNKRPFTVWAAQVLLSIYFLVILMGSAACLGFIEMLKVLAGFLIQSSADVVAGASVRICVSAALIEGLIQPFQGVKSRRENN